MSRAVLQPFEEYQKARIAFVQNIAELASRPKNIEALHSAGVMALLRPLLLDSVPSIQQSAALAIGRLASYSEEIAKDVTNNDIVSQLIYSLPKQNRFFKKAACEVLQSVAQHSVELAQAIVDAGAIDHLVQCLDEYDPDVKESAAIALGHIAKHNANLAQQVVDARAVDSLILCLQEPEILLKRAAALTLSYICQHTEQLAQPVAENGLDAITFFLSYNDTQLRRNICQLLGNITKHSPDLATQVMAKINNPQKLLSCLKDPDDIVKKNSAFCICEIVNKSPENAQAICSAGGAGVLVDFISNIRGDPRLYGILSLGFIAAFKDDLAMNVIQAKAIPQLRDALQNEPHQHIKAASCYSLGHLGRHSEKHAEEVSNENVLSLMLYYYMDPNSSEDLKLKSKKALKKIIDSCANLSVLDPLLHVAPKNILKHILQQYVKNLKGNTSEMKRFAQDGGLQKLQELKMKATEKIKPLIEEINSFYPPDIVKYYSPDYAAELLGKISGGDKNKPADDEK